VAHHISDLIYEQLTGEKGAFNTQIAYITTTGTGAAKSYTLMVADSDGYNPQTILRSNQPLMSPAWSADGRQIAYVSFEKKTAEIYLQDVGSGSRRKVASFQGINGAPAWSPDGQRLALTLSQDGNPEIYVMDLNSKALNRLTNSPAIDTEPVWSPDGRSIVFTSDRGGSPQLYRIAAAGGQPQRLTFDGKYNAGADFSPDGRKLAMVHGEDGARARRDPLGDVSRIEVARRGIDVRENRSGTAARDRLGRREKGERRADDLVARTDTECIEHKDDRVRAVRDADRLACAEIVGRLALERGHVRPQDELAALEHAVDRLADAGEQRVVLSFYVNQRDRTHGRKV